MYTFPGGDLGHEECPKKSNDDFFLPNLVSFLVPIIIRVGINHLYILSTVTSYKIHTLTYIFKHAGEYSFTPGLDEIKNVEDQPIKTNQIYSIKSDVRQTYKLDYKYIIS